MTSGKCFRRGQYPVKMTLPHAVSPPAAQCQAFSRWQPKTLAADGRTKVTDCWLSSEWGSKKNGTIMRPGRKLRDLDLNTEYSIAA